MKSKLTIAGLILTAAYFMSCKKDAAIENKTVAERNDLSLAVMAVSGVPVNSVLTVAGRPYTSGPTLVNGTAENARFNNPFGIQLMDDGTIYVADTNNDIIRVVSASGSVSSFAVPDHNYVSENFWLHSPKYVGIDKNNVIYTIDDDPLTPRDRLTMYTSGSNIIGGYGGDNYDAKDLVKDPYTNGFWSTSGNILKKVTAKQSNSSWTEDLIKFTNKFLPDEPGFYTYPALFAGYNGVIYFAYKGKLYKHSKDNTGSVIFSNLTFNSITCIAANKDSRTLYIADGGYIKRIDNGKLSVIAGPNNTFTDSRDGVGSKADVNAQYLALSKDESTLYFSDARADAIRKIILK
ncbi:NHL repeat-containing protein [Mucilaginibacter psychrotolerans]|uniref:NHL repeat-containing protein n=1 Tax=Mucilaginibacter psychrotolerans TaxID=1524096 RepID=A0A4Y8SN27_9SPHI|nr:hypothetical protein [Mucilaginibacter psychrotolerans]TFF39814.1 hypothetical protein E2R66_05480 [Mucilaginibacter psychrotolerans]